MSKKPYILGICAANSGSGKTFVIEKLIPELKKRGYSSSAIKHAHHNFDIDKPGKDSFKIRESGAKQTLIFNAGRSALITENKKNDANVSEKSSKRKSASQNNNTPQQEPIEFGSKEDYQLIQAMNHLRGLPVKTSKPISENVN